MAGEPKPIDPMAVLNPTHHQPPHLQGQKERVNTLGALRGASPALQAVGALNTGGLQFDQRETTLPRPSSRMRDVVRPEFGAGVDSNMRFSNEQGKNSSVHQKGAPMVSGQLHISEAEMEERKRMSLDQMMDPDLIRVGDPVIVLQTTRIQVPSAEEGKPPRIELVTQGEIYDDAGVIHLLISQRVPVRRLTSEEKTATYGVESNTIEDLLQEQAQKLRSQAEALMSREADLKFKEQALADREAELNKKASVAGGAAPVVAAAPVASVVVKDADKDKSKEDKSKEEKK